MAWEWEFVDGQWCGHADLRGKNLAEVLAIAGDAFDAVVARQLEEYELWLRDEGELGNDDEELLVVHLRRKREQAQARKVDWLAELRRSLLH